MDMDHDGVASVASDMNELALTLQEVQRYALGDGIKAEHFGSILSGPGAFASLDAGVRGLAESIGKAQQFCAQASQLLTTSSKATKNTDVDNAWGITKAGGE